jgi:hypothetical protein
MHVLEGSQKKTRGRAVLTLTSRQSRLATGREIEHRAGRLHIGVSL